MSRIRRAGLAADQGDTGIRFGATSGNGLFNLAAGEYRIEVEYPGNIGTDWFTSRFKC